MNEDVNIGSQVRYPRTGTVGKVVRIEERGGFSFAELDTTGMLYRTDLLVSAVQLDKPGKDDDHREDMNRYEKVRDLNRDISMQEIGNLDGACAGAG